jgi:hypothetical protein
MEPTETIDFDDPEVKAYIKQVVLETLKELLDESQAKIKQSQ